MNKLQEFGAQVRRHSNRLLVAMALAMTCGPVFAQTTDIKTEILSEIDANKAIALAVCTAFIIAILSIRSLKLAKRG